MTKNRSEGIVIEYCKEDVPNGGRFVGFHRCSRKAVKDGYCKQHHPNTKAAREKKRDEKYKAENQIWSIRNKIRVMEKECIAFVYRMVGSNAKATELVKKLKKLKNDLDAARDELENLSK